ncbi:MAG TPA: hypothetical protein VFV38_23195 [Ktedonobacteraceae bacterium]|nr:hypothetical protein [Ktedonobacteraceae bacterium]
MRKYCKAYRLGNLRQYEGWTEGSPSNSAELSDEDICYLYDDFIVVKSPFQTAAPLFDTVTPEWKFFCETVLKFQIPDDLRFAYE